MTEQSKGKKHIENNNDPYRNVLASIEKWNEETDEVSHMYVFSISKNHVKTLHSILRQLYDHPNIEFSSRLLRKKFEALP